MKILLEKYDFCQNLSDSYQGFSNTISDIEAKYPSKFSDLNTRDEKRREEKAMLCKELEDRLQAYYLEIAYQICKQKRLQK